MRRLLLVATGALAGLATLWAIALYCSGGVELTIAGRIVSSHEPTRPLIVGALLLAIFMLAGGDERVMRWCRAFAAWHHRWMQRPDVRRLATALVVAIALVALAVGVRYGAKVADGSDPYGYVSEAELFRAGQRAWPQPWVKDVPWPNAQLTFTPLAYTPTRGPARFALGGYAPVFDEWAIVPTYSPGLPLLMTAARTVAGHSAMFWVVPLSGAILILATYGIGRRLGSAYIGATAAALVASSQTVVGFHLSTMTDVPVSTAWAVAWWGLLGRTIGSACIAGAAAAIAVLIRPNLAPVGLVVLVWVIARVWRSPSSRGREIVRGTIALAGLGLGALAVTAIYWQLYGTPFESGYGPTSIYFGLEYIVPNVRTYLLLFAREQTPIAFLGITALFVPSKRLWPDTADRSAIWILGLFVAGVWAEFCLYYARDAALRFLLPCYPFIMIGLAGIARFAAQRSWRNAAPAVTAAVLFLCWVRVDAASREGAFSHWRDVVHAEAAEAAARETPPNSVVIAMQHSGTVRYYAGRVTLRWDELPKDWLDRGVAWMGERGVRTYALVERWELSQMKERFAGQHLAAVFDAPPVFRLEDMLFFDLNSPADPGRTTRVIPFAARPGRVPPPAPAATLAWK